MATRIDELQQALAAATNYVNGARLILDGCGGDAAARAVRQLELAEAQLLRAGAAAKTPRDEPPTGFTPG